MDFKQLQSKSLACPGDVDAICQQGHLTKCRLFEWVALWAAYGVFVQKMENEYRGS